jgi:hypothetical protein
METKTEPIKIRIGKIFWDDHVSRACLDECGLGAAEHSEDEYLVKETKTTVTLLLPEFQIHELLDDAWHYSTNGYEDIDDLVRSARGTCRAVLKQLGLPIPYGL